MTNKPLVSVIVPVYRVEQFLDDCVESILRQTYSTLEVILVDDGSPDNSGAMCDGWAQKDDRIIVVHQDNTGLNMARRAGFQRSQGEWIMFVDSDDMIHPRAIETLYDAVTTSHVAVAVGGYRKFSHADDISSTTAVSSDPIYGARDTLVKWLIAGSPCDNVFMQTAWMKLFARHVIDDIDWDYANYRANEDEFMALQYYATLDGGAVVVPEELYYYRVNSQSITRAVFKNEFQGQPMSKFETIEHVYQKSLDRLGENFRRDIELRFAADFIGFMEQYMMSGQLDDTVVDDYRRYFVPKIQAIDQLYDELNDVHKGFFLALKDKGVLGMAQRLLAQKDTHIANVEYALQQSEAQKKSSDSRSIQGVVHKIKGVAKRRIER